MGHDRRRVTAGLLTAALAALVLPTAGSTATAGPTDFAARVVPFAQRADLVEFPVLDATGRTIRTARWHVTDAGGNCCEVYLTTTSDGRIAAFGGMYPVVSADRGASWQEVQSAAPLVSGEGAIVAAPGGDVVGVGWDAYGGDHLQAYKYDGETREWRYAEVVLHQPFYDRPWIAVVKGPFQHAGGTSPYATVVMSNYHGAFTDMVLISYDGLTYTVPSAPEVEVLATAADGSAALSSGDPDLDTIQPHLQAGVVTLPGSGLLDTAPSLGSRCRTALLSTDSRWRCFTPPGDDLKPASVIDSRGRLHDTEVVGDELVYRMSADGGRTWTETALRAPNGGSFDSFTEYDVKVHGSLRRAAVAAHISNGETHQDMVFVLDTTTAPVVREIMLVGRGDVSSLSGLGQDVRFDFPTVGFLPDGSIATSFRDSTAPYVQLAVEQRR